MTRFRGKMLVVPAELVGNLRAGLLDVLASAAEEIATVSIVIEGRGLLREALERLDAVRALLDVIGWTETDPPVEVRFDLREHWQATLDALENEISASRDRVREAAAVDAARAERGEPPKREETIQRARALRQFVATVRTRLDGIGEG